MVFQKNMALESPMRATLPKNLNDSINAAREGLKFSNFIVPKDK
jgi:hypothetical protein